MTRIKIKERETGIQNAISDFLTLKNIVHYRQNSGMSVHSDPKRKGGKRFVKFMFWLWPNSTEFKEYAFLDLAGFTDSGLYWTIEVKVPDEYLTPAQINTIELVKSRHAIAFWADSVEMVIVKFKNFGVFI